MAWRLRKHILLFHLDERADWPTQHVDHSQRDVRRLRSEQTREHIVEQFSSLQLANGVRRALRGFHSVATTPVPGLLPYVVDRHAHRERLATAAIRHELERSPSLVVVHGIVGQAHHKFVPRTDGEHRDAVPTAARLRFGHPAPIPGRGGAAARPAPGAAHRSARRLFRTVARATAVAGAPRHLGPVPRVIELDQPAAVGELHNRPGGVPMEKLATELRVLLEDRSHELRVA